MKKDKNILFTVNLLSIKDLQSVRSMDASSGFQQLNFSYKNISLLKNDIYEISVLGRR